MDSIVNYESDDGNSKSTIKNLSKDSGHNKEKRRHSSDDDSSDGSDSPNERNRKRSYEDDKKSNRHSSPSRKSTHKSSRSDKYKSHDKEKVDRHRRRSSSRDNDKYDRKKRKHDERDDRKKYRQHGRDREKRSQSRDRDDHSSKDRHRDRSSERRKDRYDDRKRYNNRNEGERRYDDKRDYSYKREDSNHRNSRRNSSDNRGNSSSSNSSSAISRAEALNRTIERRANEKVQQLQKMGIEIPGLLQQQQNQLLNQTTQIKPLMSISTTGIGSQANSTNAENNTESDANPALNLSNFTSSVLTNAKYNEQLQKKKLIWGPKKAVATTTETATTNNKWEAAKFSQDSDGKMASKFLRLMGMKNVPTSTNSAGEEEGDSSVQKREQMFSSMEQQYEIARQATHTMRGMGLGFGSQSRPC